MENKVGSKNNNNNIRCIAFFKTAQTFAEILQGQILPTGMPLFS